jgi:hypothetical protein
MKRYYLASLTLTTLVSELILLRSKQASALGIESYLKTHLTDSIQHENRGARRGGFISLQDQPDYHRLHINTSY